MDLQSKLSEIATNVRKEIEEKYLYSNKTLGGTCIEASSRIVLLLKNEGIESKLVQGFVEYDMPPEDIGEPFDEHCWVEVSNGEDYWYIDVTASQFNRYVLNEFDAVIISKEKPANIVYEEDIICNEYETKE